MHSPSKALHTCTSFVFRSLGKKYSSSLVLIGTVMLAGCATLYLPQTASLAGSIRGSAHSTLPNRACEDQNYAWSVYTQTTSYYYCPENVPQP
jgi:hypothetical protein